MSDPFEGQVFPRWVLWGAAAAIAVTIGIAAWTQLTDHGGPQIATTPAVTARDIRFVEDDTGLAVYDATDGNLIKRFEPDGEGFLRGVLRSVHRERERYQVAQSTPLRVAQRADGQVTLEDLGTGQVIDLRAYGPTNVAAFARFLEPTTGRE